jgi:hypothetical protein
MTQSEFFDKVKLHLKLKTDVDLAVALRTHRTYLSRLRTGKLPIEAVIIIRVHYLTDWSIAEIKAMLGLPKFVRTV